MLEDLHGRLAGVIIECLDWSPFIDRYYGADTLFYLDPPYWGSEGGYGKHLFSRLDYKRMADQLGTIKGRFLMSLNDVPELRAVFSAFVIKEVSTVYTVAGTGARQASELLISNRI